MDLTLRVNIMSKASSFSFDPASLHSWSHATWDIALILLFSSFFSLHSFLVVYAGGRGVVGIFNTFHEASLIGLKKGKKTVKRSIGGLGHIALCELLKSCFCVYFFIILLR